MPSRDSGILFMARSRSSKKQLLAAAAMDPEVDQAGVTGLAEPNRVLAKGGDLWIRLQANPLPQTVVVKGADRPSVGLKAPGVSRLAAGVH